jgi:glycerophosphoryl diester phosphodiesterase
MKHMPFITEHSGCESTPVDSLESVLTAFELGADIVEVDIRRAPDDSIRISHDPITLNTYKKLISLEYVFSLIKKKNNIAVNCDIKEDDVIFEVLAEAEKKEIPANRLYISGSVKPEILTNDPSIIKKARFLLNIRNVSQDLFCRNYCLSHAKQSKKLENMSFVCEKEYASVIAEFYISIGSYGINMPFEYISKQTSDIYKSFGLPVSVWTVDKPDDIRRMISYDVFNITTRNVKEALLIRKSYNEG